MTSATKTDSDYWQEVEAAYSDCLRERMGLPDDELWEFAKERATRRRQCAFLEEKAKREGRSFLSLLKEADRADRDKKKN